MELKEKDKIDNITREVRKLMKVKRRIVPIVVGTLLVRSQIIIWPSWSSGANLDIHMIITITASSKNPISDQTIPYTRAQRFNQVFCPGFLFVIHLLNLFCFLYSVQQQERESARESVPLLLRESFLSPKVRCSFTLTENTVEPWFNEVPGDWGNLCVISRDRYIEHLHITNFRENYQNVP